MRVVITGGAGFLGSHLSEHLLALGHRVCCVDSLITGRTENVAALEQRPEFEFLCNTTFPCPSRWRGASMR